MSSSHLVAEDDPLIGSRIDGRYTVFSVLGQGGMGVVYDGVHDELGRSVAIKVLNAAWASDRTAVERFLREARTASSFSHGNIVDVSDLGRLSDGRPYLVMPKISGVDLATLLTDNGPQPAKRVAALLTGVAAALDLVHAKGYVHRDIKPENLMYVVHEDGSETVMLLDFGIAAAMMTSGPRLTRQGAIFGTPQYLPPEVCTGGRPDARGDVYALAGVAFELITGTLLFPIDDIMQLMAVKVAQEAPTLSSATGQSFPPEVEAVIARGLTRNPNDRYSSAGSFVRALRDATEYAPVSWRTGVLRSSFHSAEHQLPQHLGEQGWSNTPAPSWTAQQHPDQQRYLQRSSADHMHDSRSQRPPQGSNAGAWGMHANHSGSLHPSDQYRQQDARLRMMDDEPSYRTSGRPRQRTERVSRPIGRYVIFAGAAAAVAIAATQYFDVGAKAVTDIRGASSVAAPVARPVQPPAAAPAPAQASATDRPARPRNAGQARAARTQEPAVQQLPADNQEPAQEAPAAEAAAPLPTPEAAEATAAVEPTVEAAAAPQAAEQPEAQPPLAAAAPRANANAQKARAARSSTRRSPEAWAPEAPPEPVYEPAAPAVVVTETPAPVEPPPAAAAPAVPSEPPPPSAAEQATALTRKSSEALLRGEVSRAVEQARKATTVDPSYPLAWRTLGLALERSGTSAAAVSAYEEYLRRAPTGPQSEMVRQRMQALSR